MPHYDYRCDACDEEFETFQSIHDAALRDCPHCHKPELQRLISGAGLVFKGSGFYVNDSKATQKSPAPGKSKTSSDATTDASPSPKPDASDKAKN